MKCEEIQNKILLNDSFIEHEKSHIETCPECKSFNKDFGIIMQSENLDVPSHLDDKVLSFSKQNRPSNSKTVIPFLLFAVAALVAIAFTVSALNKVKADDGVVASTENVDSVEPNQEVVKLIEETTQDKQDEIIESLWEDDQIDADLLALEGELFVLSAELYSE